MLATAVLPVPPLAELTVTELSCGPSAIAVAFMENVQDAPSASVAPARVTVLDAGKAVMTPPPQDPLSPLGVATTKPAGKVSVKETPVRAVAAFGLTMVKL